MDFECSLSAALRHFLSRSLSFASRSGHDSCFYESARTDVPIYIKNSAVRARERAAAGRVQRHRCNRTTKNVSNAMTFSFDLFCYFFLAPFLLFLPIARRISAHFQLTQQLAAAPCTRSAFREPRADGLTTFFVRLVPFRFTCSIYNAKSS